MPEIRCDLGHVMSVTTIAWGEQLTLDQLHFARNAMDEKINAAEAQPRRTVWRICRGNVRAASARGEHWSVGNPAILDDQMAQTMLQAFGVTVWRLIGGRNPSSPVKNRGRSDRLYMRDFSVCTCAIVWCSRPGRTAGA